MATIRRLSDDDVRAIFESVHNNRLPPPNLMFKVVPVGPNGLKLSPPSFEFDDGLYILLKPEKKIKKQQGAVDPPKVPSNLVPRVWQKKPPTRVSWSLSGPQFPQPTAIQQRYCYPKGDQEYSSRKGGALWTMYGPDGKENLEYRLLHVYFSAKRAVNKGVTVPPEKQLSSPTSTPNQTPVRKRAKTTPNRKQNYMKTPSPPGMYRSRSPVLSFDLGDVPSNLSPMASLCSPVRQAGNFVTPPAGAGASMFEQRFHPVTCTTAATDIPSPFRPRILDHPARTSHAPVVLRHSFQEDEDNEGTPLDATSVDPFPWEDNDTTLDELEKACWNEHDSFFSSPPMLASSLVEGGDHKGASDKVAAFRARLESLKESLKNQISSATASEQELLWDMLASWGKEMGQWRYSGKSPPKHTPVTPV